MKKIVVTLMLVMAITVMLNAFDRDCDNTNHAEHFKAKEFNGQRERMLEKEGFHFQFMLQELDLSDAQKEKIDGYISSHKKQMIELKADIDIKMVDKHDAAKDHDFSRMKKIVSEVMELKKDMALKQIDHHENIWNILTLEQQEKADEMKKPGHNKKMNFHKQNKIEK